MDAGLPVELQADHGRRSQDLPDPRRCRSRDRAHAPRVGDGGAGCKPRPRRPTNAGAQGFEGSRQPTTYRRLTMNRMKVALSTLALGLALGLSQAANAQPTLELETRIMTQMKTMKMVDKDGMITKKDAMVVLEKKFDAMAKGGRMTAAEFAAFVKTIGEGNLNP
jgi:hypothetical protein